jgi:hypothetical protein
MEKKNIFITVAVLYTIFLAIAAMNYRKSNPVVKINRDKASVVNYTYEIEKNEMGAFNVGSSITKDDVNSIVDSLNKGVLKPDENETGSYTKEHIEIHVLNDRIYSIYKQGDGRFMVMYSTSPGSNDTKYDRQTTIESKVLQEYFKKFREVAEKSEPYLTWEINTYLTPDASDLDPKIKPSDVVWALNGSHQNLNKLSNFMNNVESKAQDKIRIISYTKEGDLIIDILQFDGSIIKTLTDTTRDRWGHKTKYYGWYTKIIKVKNGSYVNYTLVDETGKHPEYVVFQDMESVSSNFKIYKNSDLGYEIVYPENYQVQLSGGHSPAANPEFEMRLSLYSKEGLTWLDIDSINKVDYKDKYQSVEDFIKYKQLNIREHEDFIVNDKAYKIYILKDDKYYFAYFENDKHIFQLSSSSKDMLKSIMTNFKLI